MEVCPAYGHNSCLGQQLYGGLAHARGRNDDWINATYESIRNNATFTTYGSVAEKVKGFLLIVR